MIALTHIELLLGCAIPVWIWVIILLNYKGELLTSIRLLPHLGWLTVGIGDTAVSSPSPSSLIFIIFLFFLFSVFGNN